MLAHHLSFLRETLHKVTGRTIVFIFLEEYSDHSQSEVEHYDEITFMGYRIL